MHARSLLSAWVFFGYSCFLPLSKIMHVKLTGDSKMTIKVSVHDCFSVYPGYHPKTARIAGGENELVLSNTICIGCNDCKVVGFFFLFTFCSL